MSFCVTAGFRAKYLGYDMNCPPPQNLALGFGLKVEDLKLDLDLPLQDLRLYLECPSNTWKFPSKRFEWDLSPTPKKNLS